jgi:hypothetical protein
LHIVNIKSKLEDCYECDGSPYKAYWYNISKEFLKIYKEYTDCDYPVYASMDNSKYIITEKPIEKIKEEIKENLEILYNQKNDKRVIRYKDVIASIKLWLENDCTVLKKVSYEDINKDFMTGEGVSERLTSIRMDFYRSLRIPYYTWTSDDNIFVSSRFFIND